MTKVRRAYPPLRFLAGAIAGAALIITLHRLRDTEPTAWMVFLTACVGGWLALRPWSAVGVAIGAALAVVTSIQEGYPTVADNAVAGALFGQVVYGYRRLIKGRPDSRVTKVVGRIVDEFMPLLWLAGLALFAIALPAVANLAAILVGQELGSTVGAVCVFVAGTIAAVGVDVLTWRPVRGGWERLLTWGVGTRLEAMGTGRPAWPPPHRPLWLVVTLAASGGLAAIVVLPPKGGFTWLWAAGLAALAAGSVGAAACAVPAVRRRVGAQIGVWATVVTTSVAAVVTAGIRWV